MKIYKLRKKSDIIFKDYNKYIKNEILYYNYNNDSLQNDYTTFTY